MIQDIYTHFDNSYHDLRPDETSRAFLFEDDKLFIRYDDENHRLVLPLCDEFEDGHFQYLFKTDITYFLITDQKNKPDGYDFYTLREIRAFPLERNDEIFLCYSGYHLHKWYENNCYCGRCGKKMIHSQTERALICPECHKRYDDIDVCPDCELKTIRVLPGPEDGPVYVYLEEPDFSSRSSKIVLNSNRRDAAMRFPAVSYF